MTGRIRLFYTNNESNGGSFFAFVGKPVIKLNIDPVIGGENQLEVKNFPKIRQFIEEMFVKAIDVVVFPNRANIGIPVTKDEDTKWY